jgi:hypothetical protein
VHLLTNYRNIIIYCNSQKEGKLLNILMNLLQPNCSDYIDCNTSKKKRDIIIEKYKNGAIPFLVNVRILVEGFDAPITKGVCFLHLPTNKTTLIQIIGRCLRLHPTKTIANIILPFSSKEDEKNICNFLKVMAKNDTRIKQSFESKTLGGYISIENLEENDDEENQDIEFKYNMIYDSMGILQNSEEIWMKRLDELKKYIDSNNKRPTSRDKNIKIKKLACWVYHQIDNYKKKEDIMKNEEIYNKWTEFVNDHIYKKYFLSNEDRWLEILNQVKIFIDTNNKRPSFVEKNENIQRLSSWISMQQQSYKNKKYIMSNEIIYNNWLEFINDPKYKLYFQSNQDTWNETLNQVKHYINNNNKRPNKHDKDIKIKQLGCWITAQSKNYNNKTQIMSNEEIYNKWTEFINDNKYKIYFISNEEAWIDKLNEVKKYIDINDKKPNLNDTITEIKSLGKWISTQVQNHKVKKEIMKNEEIYNKWTQFTNDYKYKKYFVSNEERWIETLNQVKLYIDTNNKRPSSTDKNIKIKQLSSWIITQQTNYKNKEQIMSNEEIYNLWTEFIVDLKYKVYFESNENIWMKTLDEVKKYINDNNKRPSSSDKNLEIKTLGRWSNSQSQNYKNKENIMKNEEIYNLWTEFINDNKYKIYFTSNEDIWIESFNKVKKYMNDNNKRPSTSDNDFEIKKLGGWISHQQNNHQKKEDIMKNKEIYNQWTQFTNDNKYKKYFLSNEDIWIETLDELKHYINVNNKKPSHIDKSLKKLYNFINTQKLNYKNKEQIMKNEDIYNKWTDFISDPKYKKYF